MLTLVAGGLVEARHVIYPVRRLLRRRCFSFREREVRAIDLERRRVETLDGPIDYDYLVLALGARTNFYGIPNMAELSFPFKTVADAVRLRNHIIDMFERAALESDPAFRRELLTFVIVGGGPTGVELAANLHDFMHHSLVEEYPTLDFSEVRVILIERKERVLPNLPEDLGRVAERTLRGKRVEMRLEAAVSAVEADRLTLMDGNNVPTHTVIWAAGVEASPVVAALPVEKGRGGAVVVNEYFQLPEHPEVFALGDNASVVDPRTGAPLPADAKVAIREADWVAKNVLHSLRGEPLERFQYKPIGDMISLGTWAAVADIRGLKISGFPAWLLWRTFYLGRLFGAENKLRVMGDWVLESFFERDTARVEAA
jgi:NADH dehydrogenase